MKIEGGVHVNGVSLISPIRSALLKSHPLGMFMKNPAYPGIQILSDPKNFIILMESL